MSTRKVESIGNVEEVGVVRYHLRGREIVIREMEADAYEEALRSALIVDADGNPTDKTDMLVLEKLLAVGSVTIDDKEIDLEAWGKEKYPVTSRILNDVKRLHWLDLDTDEEASAKEQAKREAARAKAKSRGADLPNS